MSELISITEASSFAKSFLIEKPLPVSDVFFNIINADASNEGSINDSLINESYFTSTNHDDRLFKFKDWFSATKPVSIAKDLSGNQIFYSPTEQREIIKLFVNLYSLVYKKLIDLESYKNNEVDINYAVKFDFGSGTCSLRNNYMPIVGGWNINVRTKPPKTPYMEELDIYAPIRDILLSPELKNGLVLISGDHGDGKTTTATSAMVSRLRLFGGHCNAYEDPVEYDSQGFHGDNGYCLQTNVNGAYGPYIKAAMRKYPITKHGVMYVGELRDAETVRLAIQASARGCLVIATMHAVSIIAALKSLVSMLSVDGNHERAADLLSSSFRFILHQHKTLNPRGDGWKKFNISGELFFALSTQVQDIINSSIAKSSFEKLKPVIKIQNELCSKYKAGTIGLDVLLRGLYVN